MAGSLTDTWETNVLNWLAGAAATAPTTPLMLALVTANGTDSAAGTEVSGGSYGRQEIDISNGANTNTITFAGMPACTVVGVEVWDSNGTPSRIWHDSLTANKTVAAGDSVQFAVGAVTTALD